MTEKGTTFVKTSVLFSSRSGCHVDMNDDYCDNWKKKPVVYVETTTLVIVTCAARHYGIDITSDKHTD